MTEIERLRTALGDIAAGGGWQGRHAQAVLDATPEGLPKDVWTNTAKTAQAYVRAIRAEMCRQGIDISRAGGA